MFLQSVWERLTSCTVATKSQLTPEQRGKVLDALNSNYAVVPMQLGSDGFTAITWRDMVAAFLPPPLRMGVLMDSATCRTLRTPPWSLKPQAGMSRMEAAFLFPAASWHNTTSDSSDSDDSDDVVAADGTGVSSGAGVAAPLAPAARPDAASRAREATAATRGTLAAPPITKPAAPTAAPASAPVPTQAPAPVPVPAPARHRPATTLLSPSAASARSRNGGGGPDAAASPSSAPEGQEEWYGGIVAPAASMSPPGVKPSASAAAAPRLAPGAPIEARGPAAAAAPSVAVGGRAMLRDGATESPVNALPTPPARATPTAAPLVAAPKPLAPGPWATAPSPATASHRVPPTSTLPMLPAPVAAAVMSTARTKEAGAPEPIASAVSQGVDGLRIGVVPTPQPATTTQEECERALAAFASYARSRIALEAAMVSHQAAKSAAKPYLPFLRGLVDALAAPGALGPHRGAGINGSGEEDGTRQGGSTDGVGRKRKRHEEVDGGIDSSEEPRSVKPRVT